MLRNILLSGAALAALGTCASAADLPARVAPAPYIAPAPIFTWTGFYIGANVGAGFRNNNNTVVVPNGVFPGVPAFVMVNPAGNNNDNTGILGGGQIGYNWQAGTFVFGIEADIQGMSNGNNNNIAGVVPVGGNAAVFVPGGNNNSNWFGTVRGRLGIAYDRVLFYGTGGLAYGGGNSNAGVVNYFAPGNIGLVPDAVYTSTNTNGNNNLGYSVGAGVEYAFTNNWTMKAEYLYVSLGKHTNLYVPTTGAAPAGTSFSGANTSNRFSVVRVGLNYKF